MYMQIKYIHLLILNKSVSIDSGTLEIVFKILYHCFTCTVTLYMQFYLTWKNYTIYCLNIA